MGTERFTELIRAGSEAFIHNGGFRRTQMNDVARLMDVAPGTLYRYVEGKAALFDVIVRHADDPESFETPRQLPIANPPADQTLSFVKKRVTAEAISTTLAQATEAPPSNPYQEAVTIFTEIFATFRRWRWSIKVLDVSARDYPELASLWFTHGKQRLLKEWGDYLSRRMNQGCFARAHDPHLAAYFMMEVVVCWAVHKHFDPTELPRDPKLVEAMALRFAMSPLRDEGVNS